jgi:hypothetical protein
MHGGSAQVTIGGLASRVHGLRGSERLSLIGIVRDGVGDALRAHAEGGRSALLLESATRDAEAMLDGLLNDIADLAFAQFPQWYACGEMTVELAAVRRTARECQRQAEIA